MNRPLLSIIIPTYNSGKYIRRTLNRVLKYPLDAEIIVVDDGSTDNTLKILKRYESIYFNINVFKKEHGGVASARNLGLDNAKGEYIFFLDADDLLTKNVLLLENVVKNGKPDIVKYDFVSQRVVRILFKYNSCFDNRQEGYVSVDEVRKKILTTTNFNSVCTQLIRRTLTSEIKFDEKYIMAEDLDFNLRLYNKVSDIYYLPKPIIKYMYNIKSATRNVSETKLRKQLLDMNEVYSKLYVCRDKWKVNINKKKINKHIKNILSGGGEK